MDKEAGIIVKPVVSASAYNTHRLVMANFTPEHPAYEEVCDLLLTRPMMIQPYLSAIETIGEISMIYFQGQFHHAIRKTPAPQDFRIQEKYGGSIEPHNPTPQEAALAQQTIDCYRPVPLYARIDLVYLADGTPAVIECELTEPSLYLKFHPQAAQTFARCLQDALIRERTSAPTR
jgi:glutathione synthase/RimK-type ligase-like ATP-grasp enzyme